MTLSYNTEDYSDLEPMGLADGAYKVYISDEEFLDLENPDNQNPLKLTFEVVEGASKGKTHTELYSINHKNEQPRTISQGRLKSLAEKSGGAANASNPLKGRTCIITVKKKGEYTNITSVKPDSDEV